MDAKQCITTTFETLTYMMSLVSGLYDNHAVTSEMSLFSFETLTLRDCSFRQNKHKLDYA